MAESALYAGIDLHQNSVTLAVLAGHSEDCAAVRALAHDLLMLTTHTRVARCS